MLSLLDSGNSNVVTVFLSFLLGSRACPGFIASANGFDVPRGSAACPVLPASSPTRPQFRTRPSARCAPWGRYSPCPSRSSAPRAPKASSARRTARCVSFAPRGPTSTGERSQLIYCSLAGLLQLTCNPVTAHHPAFPPVHLFSRNVDSRNESACVACPLGHFAPFSMNDNCIECKAGSATGKESGATSCAACGPGQFSSGDEVSICRKSYYV